MNNQHNRAGLVLKISLWTVGYVLLTIAIIIGFFLLATFGFVYQQTSSDEKDREETKISAQRAEEALANNEFLVDGFTSSGENRRGKITATISDRAFTDPTSFASAMNELVSSEKVESLDLTFDEGKQLTVAIPGVDDVSHETSEKTRKDDGEFITAQGWQDLLEMTQNEQIQKFDITQDALLKLSIQGENTDTEMQVEGVNTDARKTPFDSVKDMQTPDGLLDTVIVYSFTALSPENNSYRVDLEISPHDLSQTFEVLEAIEKRKWTTGIREITVSSTFKEDSSGGGLEVTVELGPYTNRFSEEDHQKRKEILVAELTTAVQKMGEEISGTSHFEFITDRQLSFTSVEYETLLEIES